MHIDFSNIYLYHGLVIFGELTVILVFVHMIYKKRTPAGIVAWLLFIVLVPYIAVFFYMIFGLRKRGNRYKKKDMRLLKHTHSFLSQNPIHNILQSYGIGDATAEDNFELLSDPVQAYEKFIKCISGAKESIYIGTYIFEYDKVGKEIVRELIKKAREGLQIKLLIDSLGSYKLYFSQYRLKKLREAGVQVEFFMPILNMPFRNYINLRNHRKIYIFDGQKVLSGGMNISDNYLARHSDKTKWIDILFFCEGRVAENFFEIFASDWFYASQEKVSLKRKSTPKNEKYFLQVVPSGPDMDKDILYEALLSAIYSAKKRIWIVTPYFIPDDSIMQALVIAKNKGVDVKLITPKDSNHLLVNMARGSYMRELKQEGIEVIFHIGVMLHAKAILFDDDSVMLGSVNLDNRSLFLNYEVATFVYSQQVVAEVELWIKQVCTNSSQELKEVSAIREVVENLMRIVAPQL